MQVFGDQDTTGSGSASAGKTIQIGSSTIKIIKVSSLALGTHPVRLYPLSPDYYKGADYPLIVQSFHWINRQPIICRQNSYDYTVPDTQEKPIIDTHCDICRDKFKWFRKAKELGFKTGAPNNPPEAVVCHKSGKSLMERYSAASIVSFVEQGNLAFPVVLTYGKELMDRIQFTMSRIFTSMQINICDPQKGYMFDIIIGTKPNSKQRDYKNSANSMNTSPVDITIAPWKWNEICFAIKSEIVTIPTAVQVRDFYISNSVTDSNTDQFVHPMFNKSNPGQLIVPLVEKELITSVVETPVNPVSLVDTIVPNNPIKSVGVNVPAQTTSVEKSTIPTFTPPKVENTSFPCHASLPNTAGYDEQDANCKSCSQVQACYDAKSERVTKQVSVNNNVGIPVQTTSVNSEDSGVPSKDAIKDDVQSRLNELNVAVTK